MIKNRGDKWSENEISLTKELYQKGVKLMERKNKMIEDYLAEKEFKAA